MSTPIETAAERLSDSLTQLGVDPDERPEHGGRSIAEVLGAAALASLAQHRVDIARVLDHHSAEVEDEFGNVRCSCADTAWFDGYPDHTRHQADAVLAYLTGEES